MHRLRRSKRARRLVAGITLHRKKIIITAGILIGIVVLAQLLYPGSRTLPFARIGGEPAGRQSKQEVALALSQSFQDYTLVYEAGDKQLERRAKDLGATVRSDEMLNDALDYPLIYRLIPFSIVWYRTMPSDFNVDWSESVLDEASDEVADELSYKPIDASIAIKPSGETTVTEASKGLLVSSDEILRQTRSAALHIAADSRTIQLDAELIEPAVKDDDVRTIKQTVESILDTTLEIAIEDRAVVRPTKSDMAKWISVAKTKEGMVKLEADTSAINSYIAGLTNEYGTKPTQTVVTLVDGVETTRTPGKTGKGINSSELGDKLARLITQPSTADGQLVTAQFAPIPSPIKRNATYTSSLAGLRAYAADLARDGNIKISVRQLGGNGWSAGGGEWDSVVAASTYKPYVFLRVFDDIDQGKIDWDDKIDGVTYEKCLEDTIVISANECPMALIEKYDKFKLTSYLRGKGFSSGTGFTFKEATQTTAGDLTKLMAGIEQSTLAKKNNRERLLSAMNRQIYRQGIPAGTSASVYNKVGFLWDYLNDAAIVRHPQGTYVLAVMTKGESWAKIAEITRKVESILYG